MTPSSHPLLYQWNTRLLLRELSTDLGRPATLDDIPDAAIDHLAAQGFEWVYCLGVWQTGEAALRLSRTSAMRNEYRRVLPDLKTDDIVGSCFAVTGYTVLTSLGGDEAMRRLHERLNRRGLRLMLDFIPNHVALDHPWTQTHPEYFISGTPADLKRERYNYIRIQTPSGVRIFAHGRDPYFPGWSDTLQLDHSNPQLQAALCGELLHAASLCDGLRCDMAMLILPEIFERTWGRPARPFWPDSIQSVRAEYPGFTFMAEVYWDLEFTLLGLGFDFTYDKRLYDRLREGNLSEIRAHLRADLSYLKHMVHFLENHDEPRAAATFPLEAHRAAAVATFFAPGLRFFHQGEFEGRKVRVPVQLSRGPHEPLDSAVAQLYDDLLRTLRDPLFHAGDWQLLDTFADTEARHPHDSLLAFAWQSDSAARVVVVNYAPAAACGVVHLPFAAQLALQPHQGGLTRLNSYEYSDPNLTVDLPAWGTCIFSSPE